MTMLSNSVAAGEDIQLNPTTLKPVASISPRKPAMLPLEGKYANRRHLGYVRAEEPDLLPPSLNSLETHLLHFQPSSPKPHSRLTPEPPSEELLRLEPSRTRTLLTVSIILLLPSQTKPP
ncbi:hypothetical protein G4B88_029980 [Cannabis sativa]|uniref:Uncharacterized protein n=1 Tax=Cannabis sativa TaxID=3483 RepID=A0A7J6GB07_CANSA|nr:hypothetical protein G4B88_029980 [Cannabis sativa]